MIDADHAQSRAVLEAGDGDGGLIEGGGDIVQRDGVEGVGAVKVSFGLVKGRLVGDLRIGADVADDGEVAVGALGEGFDVDEGWSFHVSYWPCTSHR